MTKDNQRKIKVGISIGDLNGIGPEIIIKSLEDSRVLDLYTPVIFANVKTMSFYKNHFKSKINFYGAHNDEKIVDGKVNVINAWKEKPNIQFGKNDKTIGAFAIKSLEAAVKSLKKNTIDVLVTAPINKENIQSDTFNFPGHTDYLNQELDGNSLMFMVTDDLKVGLLTDHVPLKDITNHLNHDLIEKKIKTIRESLQKDFLVSKPRVAILAINPHAGDNGVIGSEDDDLLIPVVKKEQEKGNLVYGPYAADSFFGSGNYKNFDAIIAAYHDQGLIPFKTIAFGEGVNYTAGLEKVRTSPDHGTAYEIAGKGESNASSFIRAVELAIEIFRNRNTYENLTKNPLKIKKVERRPQKRFSR